MKQLDPIGALKLIRGLAFAASGSHELGYRKTTVRDVRGSFTRPCLRNSATKQNPAREHHPVGPRSKAQSRIPPTCRLAR